MPAQNTDTWGQGLGPPVKQGDLPDDIAEAQDQTSHYDSRDQGGKYLRQAAHDPLKHVLVCLAAFFTASLDTPSIPATATKSL